MPITDPVVMNKSGQRITVERSEVAARQADGWVTESSPGNPRHYRGDPQNAPANGPAGGDTPSDPVRMIRRGVAIGIRRSDLAKFQATGWAIDNDNLAAGAPLTEPYPQP